MSDGCVEEVRKVVTVSNRPLRSEEETVVIQSGQGPRNIISTNRIIMKNYYEYLFFCCFVSLDLYLVVVKLVVKLCVDVVGGRL